MLDATETERAVLVSVSRSALTGRSCVPARHPSPVSQERCSSARAFPPLPGRAISSRTPSTSRLDTDDGWAKYNRHYWLEHYVEFLEYFFGKIFSEPHSTKQIEDCVGWGLEIAPETLIGPRGARALKARARDVCDRVRCPVLVIHGDEDALHPLARDALARQPAAGSSRSKAPGTARTCATQ